MEEEIQIKLGTARRGGRRYSLGLQHHHWEAACTDQPAHLHFSHEPEFLPSARLPHTNLDTTQALSICRLYVFVIILSVMPKRTRLSKNLALMGLEQKNCLVWFGLLAFVSLWLLTAPSLYFSICILSFIYMKHKTSISCRQGFLYFSLHFFSVLNCLSNLGGLGGNQIASRFLFLKESHPQVNLEAKQF